MDAVHYQDESRKLPNWSKLFKYWIGHNINLYSKNVINSNKENFWLEKSDGPLNLIKTRHAQATSSELRKIKLWPVHNHDKIRPWVWNNMHKFQIFEKCHK